jgi:hypothetical protein
MEAVLEDAFVLLSDRKIGALKVRRGRAPRSFNAR